ncbi:anaerobic ribonucleoside-triphosphate reductase [Pararhodospirillum photometricum]|uniref:anaerobic ribonucleoside-triphosphate reductase n=1 Tax=Pararhodospirillum photometricum TaxID=1084 RepID=UPI000310597C|nr:anaerobic ribonucleoside-triphosphate reductase [Pararhodospirillum photometricum]
MGELIDDAERQPCEVWTRVMGYHRPVSSFNVGKRGEFAERVNFCESVAFCKDLVLPGSLRGRDGRLGMGPSRLGTSHRL